MFKEQQGRAFEVKFVQGSVDFFTECHGWFDALLQETSLECLGFVLGTEDCYSVKKMICQDIASVLACSPVLGVREYSRPRFRRPSTS